MKRVPETARLPRRQRQCSTFSYGSFSPHSPHIEGRRNYTDFGRVRQSSLAAVHLLEWRKSGCFWHRATAGQSCPSVSVTLGRRTQEHAAKPSSTALRCFCFA